MARPGILDHGKGRGASREREETRTRHSGKRKRSNSVANHVPSTSLSHQQYFTREESDAGRAHARPVADVQQSSTSRVGIFSQRYYRNRLDFVNSGSKKVLTKNQAQQTFGNPG